MAYAATRTVLGTSDTPTTADDGGLVQYTSASAKMITLTGTSWVAGRSAFAARISGGGTAAFVAGSGVTVNGDTSIASGQTVVCQYTGSNTWEIVGTDVLPVASGGTGATSASGARTALGLGTIATQAASSVAITGGSVTGITDLAIADGGTGASTAAGARANLRAVPQYHVRDFGAVGDGVTDDTAAIQACYTAAGNDPSAGIVGADVHFGAGEFRITDTITLDHWAGRSVGAGVGNSPAFASSPGGATVIRWDGDDTSPMFLCSDTARATWVDIRFEGDATNAPTYAVEFDSTNIGRGSNVFSTFDRCHFGRYTWSSQGLNVGDLQAGIGYTGTNQMNDRIRIRDCRFNFCDVGIDIPNTQSIWSSITGCVFDTCGVGIKTGSSLNVYNFNGNANTIDLQLISTARVYVWGCWSENALQFAKMANDSVLHVYGGVIQVDNIETGSGYLVDMYPSNVACLRLSGVQFDGLTTPASALIRAGGQSASGNVGNWTIEVDECDGIDPAQVSLPAGSFWATNPLSRGKITWTSRVGTTNHAFRNYLATNIRTALAPTTWDLYEQSAVVGVNSAGSLVGSLVKVGNVAGGTVEIGRFVPTAGTNGVSVGGSSNASGVNAVAVGPATAATNTGSLAAGASANASGFTATALGHATNATHSGSVALGYDVDTTASNQVAIAARHIEAIELASDPAAPATNAGRLYFRDNGSGKTQLCVRFATGAVQVIATEP